MKLMITSGTIHNQVCITGRESMTIMRTIENNLCHQHMCQVSSQYHHLHNHRLYSSTDSIQLLSCYMVWTIILWFASWQLVTGHHNMQVTKIIVSCEISYVLNILMIRKKIKMQKEISFCFNAWHCEAAKSWEIPSSVQWHENNQNQCSTFKHSSLPVSRNIQQL